MNLTGFIKDSIIPIILGILILSIAIMGCITQQEEQMSETVQLQAQSLINLDVLLLENGSKVKAIGWEYPKAGEYGLTEERVTKCRDEGIAMLHELLVTSNVDIVNPLDIAELDEKGNILRYVLLNRTFDLGMVAIANGYATVPNFYCSRCGQYRQAMEMVQFSKQGCLWEQ